MRVVINGVDWSADIDRYSIRPFHEKVQGPNAGTSMSGSTIFDTVAIKNGFEAVFPLLSQEKYTRLITAIKGDTVTVSYDDPDTGVSVIREMVVSAQAPTQIPLNSGGFVYKNLEMTFLER